MPASSPTRLVIPRLAAAACTALALAACSSSGDEAAAEDRDHEPAHIDSAGRLAVIEAGAAALHVVDLDDRATTRITLASAPSAVYASPGRRYALAFQNADGRVEFIDGGLWQEDHGDHLHDYEEAPKKLAFTITGTKPSHYETHDSDAALFFDGEAPAANAGARLVTDAGIGAGRVDARLDLPIAVHGTAEPRGDFLLVSVRTEDAPNASPNRVALYRRDGSGFSQVRVFDAPCPGLHGSFSNEDHSAFGCTDGVLVVSQTGTEFSTSKLANPVDLETGTRIGTIAGHHARSGFVGIASPGQLFAVDPAAATITRIGWADGRTRRAHTFDHDGANFLVLDDLGVTHVLDATAGYARRSSIATVSTMPAAAPFPALAASHAKDVVYASDPAGRAIAVIDLDRLQVSERLPLDFSPSGLTWLGLEAHDHAH